MSDTDQLFRSKSKFDIFTSNPPVFKSGIKRQSWVDLRTWQMFVKIMTATKNIFLKIYFGCKYNNCIRIRPFWSFWELKLSLLISSLVNCNLMIRADNRVRYRKNFDNSDLYFEQKTLVCIEHFGTREQKLSKFHFWPACGQNEKEIKAKIFSSRRFLNFWQ